MSGSRHDGGFGDGDREFAEEAAELVAELSGGEDRARLEGSR
jgi:hypothetical protein